MTSCLVADIPAFLVAVAKRITMVCSRRTLHEQHLRSSANFPLVNTCRKLAMKVNEDNGDTYPQATGNL